MLKNAKTNIAPLCAGFRARIVVSAPSTAAADSAEERHLLNRHRCLQRSNEQ
jgi:hypothetical protein